MSIFTERDEKPQMKPQRMKLQREAKPCWFLHIYSNWTEPARHYLYGQGTQNQFVRMRFCIRCGVIQEQLVLEVVDR